MIEGEKFNHTETDEVKDRNKLWNTAGELAGELKELCKFPISIEPVYIRKEFISSMPVVLQWIYTDHKTEDKVSSVLHVPMFFVECNKCIRLEILNHWCRMIVSRLNEENTTDDDLKLMLNKYTEYNSRLNLTGDDKSD